MRRFALILALCLSATMAVAEQWAVLDGAAVRAALEGRVLIYSGGARQDFRASGKTLYNAGQDSWGNWRVQGNQYCSEWPPSDLWACYDLQSNGSVIRFIGAAGDVTDGAYDN
jgi:hypothetical protein